MVERKGGVPSDKRERYVPVEPESSGWGEWVVLGEVTAKMKLPGVEGGKTIWKEVRVQMVRNPDTNEMRYIPGGEGQPVRLRDLKGILSEDDVTKLENALRGESRRRKAKYQSRG